MRLFLVGTDTDVGKTALACALLRAGAAAGLQKRNKKNLSNRDQTDSEPARKRHKKTIK